MTPDRVELSEDTGAPEGRSAEALRAAFVTLYDASDVTMMSGTGYNISRSFLRNGTELDFIGPLRRQIRPANVLRYLTNHYLLGKNDHPQRDPSFLKHYARQVESALRNCDADVIFGAGTMPVAYIETDLPLVTWTDATFSNLLDYYAKYSNLSQRTIRNGHASERSVYARVDRAIFASQWAADTAINEYGLAPERAHVIPRGANVPGLADENQAQQIIDARPTDRCILQFVGVDWDRKGGCVAAEAARVLNERGIPTELRVVGVEPKLNTPTPEYIKPMGRISKATDAGMRRFTELLSEAHFLIVPTRAEAFGIVYLEASAYAVPSLAPRTGGVPWAMIDGVNGVLMDLDDPGEAYANEIERLFKDRDAYRALSLKAFLDHKQRTTWDNAGRQAIGVMNAAAGRPDNIEAATQTQAERP